MSTLKVTNLQHPSSASANVTLDASGNATFGGNGVFAGALTGVTDLTASGGIYLGGTGSANYLQDFETGTFTPYYLDTNSAINVSYLYQAGIYTKIGDTVHISISLRVDTTTASPTGQIRVAGLPFTVRDSNPFTQAEDCVLSMTSRFWTDPPEGARVKDGDTYIALLEVAHTVGNEVFVTGSDWNSSSSNRVIISGHYFTDS